MKKFDVHKLLKDMRAESQIPIKDVSSQLAKIGYEKVSVPTLYGYENGVSKPNADIFLSMCQIYGCENPLTFYENKKSVSFNKENNKMLNMYNKLNEPQKNLIIQMIHQLLGIHAQETQLGELSISQQAM